MLDNETFKFAHVIVHADFEFMHFVDLPKISYFKGGGIQADFDFRIFWLTHYAPPSNLAQITSMMA